MYIRYSKLSQWGECARLAIQDRPGLEAVAHRYAASLSRPNPSG